MNAASAVTLQQIVDRLGGDLVGVDAAQAALPRIDRIGPLADASATTISFLSNPRYQSQLADSQAACVIVAPAAREAAVARGAAIVVPDPYLYFARLTQWWAARLAPVRTAGVHPSALVDPGARIAPSATIGPLVVIEAGAEIGADAVIGAHCVIEAGASIGAGTRLAPRVTFGRGCRIGARGILHSGVVIGADGFGFAPKQDGSWVKIRANSAAVRISATTLKLAPTPASIAVQLSDTVIEDGVKLDNLDSDRAITSRIGAHTAIAACVPALRVALRDRQALHCIARRRLQ